MAAFRKAAKFTSAKQRRHIRSEDALKSFISGLVVRRQILTEAKEMGLDQTPEYQRRVRFEFDTFLLKEMEQRIYANMEVPEDSLRAYYEENKNLFTAEPEIRLREIVLDNEEQAVMIEKKLKQGASFGRLAREFSVRKWSAERDGELGYLKPADLGRWSQRVFALAKNEWTGPLQAGQQHIFVQCIDKKPARQLAFDQVKDDVERAVKAIRWTKIRSEKIKEIQSRVPVVAYWEKLNDIRLN